MNKVKFGKKIVEIKTKKELVKNLFNKAGGIKKVNVFYNTLKNIVDKDWFPVLEKNWTDKNKLHRCGVMCGKEINLIKDQNTEISYI